MTKPVNQQKPKSGVLFPNKKKTSPNQPDYTGTYTDESGKQLRVSAWTRTGKEGGEYLSLAFSEMNFENKKPEEQTQTRPTENNQPKNNEVETIDDNFGSIFDDIP